MPLDGWKKKKEKTNKQLNPRWNLAAVKYAHENMTNAAAGDYLEFYMTEF